MNLHRVNERIYRSDQPTADDFRELAERGVDTIVNLRRDDPKVWKAEKKLVESLGMRFFHFPFYGIFGAGDALLDGVLSVLRDPENHSILVHCREGKDRTSLIIGLYRVLVEGASIEKTWADDFVAFGHDPDHPVGAWRNPIANYFYRNIQRTFLAYARKHSKA